MFSLLGLVELGTWVDPSTLQCKTALGRLPSLCPVIAHTSPGVGGTCSAVWNRTGPVWPSLAHLHTVLAALERALVLCCNGSGDTGAVSFCHSWPHTSARVTGLQPLTLVSVHSHHARHWSHHGINGADCIVPAVPPIASTAQSDYVLQCLSVSCTHTPTQPAPSYGLRGLVFRVARTDQFPHLPSGEPPATSLIFPVLHSYTALISINPSVDPRVHCVVPLA